MHDEHQAPLAGLVLYVFFLLKKKIIDKKMRTSATMLIYHLQINSIFKHFFVFRLHRMKH